MSSNVLTVVSAMPSTLGSERHNLAFGLSELKSLIIIRERVGLFVVEFDLIGLVLRRLGELVHASDAPQNAVHEARRLVRAVSLQTRRPR